jgi:regulator of protease activity HflC (stomatin/prohibitin superfamily)
MTDKKRTEKTKIDESEDEGLELRSSRPAGPKRQLIEVSDAPARDTLPLEIHQTYGAYHKFLQCFGTCLGFMGNCPCCCCNPYVQIKDNEKAYVTEFDRYKRMMNPGPNYYNIVTERVYEHKDVIIPENHKGVKTIGGKFVALLDPGQYYANPYLLEEIKSYPEVIVDEKHRGLFVERGKFMKELEPGQHFANPILKQEIIIKQVTIVREGWRGIRSIEGKFNEVLSPGLYLENHLKEEKIDLINVQDITKALLPQEICTQDTVSIITHSVLEYTVVDPQKAWCKATELDFSIREAIKTYTQEVLGKRVFDDIMKTYPQLSTEIKNCSKDRCAEWGVLVKEINIKDIKMSPELQKILSASAEARRLAESKEIIAESEVRIAKKKREVADILNTPGAINAQFMDNMVLISRSAKASFVFMPMPTPDMGKGMTTDTAANLANMLESSYVAQDKQDKDDEKR